MKKRIMVVLLSAFLLVGCGKKLTEGEVYGKEFLPEYTTITYVHLIHSDGKTSYTTLMPILLYYPDRWRIDIRSVDEDENGNYETASYFTSEEVFDQCSIGDIFTYEPDRDYEKEPVKKEQVK